MITLFIDTSTTTLTVALIKDDNVLEESTVSSSEHSKHTMPEIEKLFKNNNIEPKSVNKIMVTNGPGSFTGLRIGSATAKGLGMVWNKPLIHVPTVDAMAYNLYGTDKLICPMMDARRNQTYTGLYEFVDGEFKIVMEQCAISVDELIVKINEIGREVIFLGDGVPVFMGSLDEKLTVSHSYAPAHMNRQRAGAVAVLGNKYFADGKYETAAEHEPNYLRQSQAEREAKEKNNG